MKLGLAVISLLVDIAKDIKAGGTADPASIVDRILASLKGVGVVADVKELKDIDGADLKPLLTDFVTKVRDLRLANIKEAPSA